MVSKYYLALFNRTSWEEFLSHGGETYGTTPSKNVRAKKIHIGDFLICYVSGTSQFIGILEVVSESYFDKTRIWRNGVFPVRFKVKVVEQLPLNSGLPVGGLKEKLSIFLTLTKQSKWGGFFINSLNEFTFEDGEFICLKIHSQSKKQSKRKIK